MIRSLSLHNFKCFADLQLEIGGLTLLTGLNGMGKSSVIQALLLLRQSNEQGFLHAMNSRRQSEKVGLVLKGDLISLGTADDVYCEFAEDNEVHLAINFERRASKWRFCYEDANTNVLDLIEEPVDVSEEEIQREMNRFGFSLEAARRQAERRRRAMNANRLRIESLFNDDFQYVQAERYGPRVSFETSDYYVRQRRQIGSHGEFAVHFLEVFGTKDVLSEMRHPQAATEQLRSQVEAWLGEISPGTRIETTPNYGTDSVSVRFGYASESIASRPYRATNVGFGLSYLLPVLVAIHDQKIEPNLVRIHFFGREEVGGTPRAAVASPTIDANGRISEWPEGFFDEWDNNLSRLLLPPGFNLN